MARVFLKIIFRGCPIIHSLNGAMLERVVNATLERFSLDCRKGLVLVLVLLRPLVG